MSIAVTEGMTKAEAAPGRLGAPEGPDILIVGAGPAGLAAATAAARAGARVLVAERDREPGGILNQCIHDGFGLTLFGESLTGPEFAARQIAEAGGLPVEMLLEATVLSIGEDRTCEILSPRGHELMRPKAIVLAMGCREKSFGSLVVPSARPAGIYSAGTAQRLVNLDGLMIGRKVVVLGSGDIGLIMARRLTLEGAEVACVVERLPYAGGLPRNVSQCLNDFDVPLLLQHTVVEVLGSRRVSGVRIARVDAEGLAVAGTQRVVECDTLLISVGLVPENEVTRAAGAKMDSGSGGAIVDQRLETSISGVFACGNVLHVHDLADWASLEGARAGGQAVRYARSPWSGAVTQAQRSWERVQAIGVRAGRGLRYVVPQRVLPGEPATISFRVVKPRRRTRVRVVMGEVELASKRYEYLAPSELAALDIPALDIPGLDTPALDVPALTEDECALEVRLD